MIVAKSGSDLRSIITDEQGMFALQDCTGGTYTLEMRDSEGINVAHARNVHCGATDVVLYVKSREAELSGAVVDAQGRPVEGAIIIFSRIDRSGAYPEARSESDGTFKSAKLGEGEYRVMLDHPKYAVQTIDGVVLQSYEHLNLGRVTVHDSGDVAVTALVPAERKVVIYLETVDGRLVGGDRATLLPPTSTVRLSRLPCLPLKCRVTDGRVDLLTVNVTPVAGQEIGVTVRLN
jgi:hypothetical protein